MPATTTRPLTAFDAQFLAGEAGNMLSHYCGLWIAGPDAAGRPLTAARVRERVAARIDHVPALRWRLQTLPLGLDHPTFVDGDVDLDRHILSHTAAAPGGTRELAEVAADVMGTKLDRRRPLWEFHVIDGLADGRVAVGMKFHHAAADALGAATLMMQLLDTTPAGPDRLPDPVLVAARPRAREILLRTAAGVGGQPARTVRAGLRTLPHLDQVPMMRTIPGARTAARAARSALRLAGRGGGQPAPLVAPRMRFNAPLSPRRTIAFGGVDVDQVRALKTAHGVSFNDVVVAAVAGGLRRRLMSGDENPAQPLLAFVPTNVRTTDHGGDIENAISSFVVPIPTDREHAADRVRDAHAAMREAKERHAAVPATLLEDANAMVFPIVFAPMAAAMLRLMGTSLVAPPLNLTLSNVPGPPMRLYLDGAPLDTVAPLSLVFDGVALNVTVVSYAGRLEIGVVGDADAVPDAWAIVADIEAEFADLHGALVHAYSGAPSAGSTEKL